MLLQELRNSNEILRPSDPERICNNVLGAQNSSFDSPLSAIYFNLDVLGLRERLRVEGARDRQELYRPRPYDNSFFLMLIVTFRFEV